MMVGSHTNVTTSYITTSTSPPLSLSLLSSPPPHHAVMSPCAACKILRRRCVEKCILAPYFPPADPLKFTTAHRVFGASNIIKFLQELPELHRADAVSTMVYEANARLRDPVYGCAGVICQLQNQVSELQQRLAKAQAEIVNMQCQHTNLIFCMEMIQSSQTLLPNNDQNSFENFDNSPRSFQSNMSFEDENNLGLLWGNLFGRDEIHMLDLEKAF